MTADDPAFGEADLTNCAREPIHIPGSIQPHGAILASAPDTWIVLQAGGNTAGFSAGICGPAGPAGVRLAECGTLPASCSLTTAQSLARPIQAFLLPHPSGGRYGQRHRPPQRRHPRMELEPHSGDRTEDSIAHVQGMVRSVQTADTYIAACQAAAEQVRATQVSTASWSTASSPMVRAWSRRSAPRRYRAVPWPSLSRLRHSAAGAGALSSQLDPRVPDARYVPAPLVPR